MVKEKFEGEVAAKFFNRDYIMKLLNEHKAGTAHNMKRYGLFIRSFSGTKNILSRTDSL